MTLQSLSTLLALLWCSFANAAESLDAPPTFRNFHHTAWTSEQGSPGDTWAVAQTTDGWLWFGGPRGLFRFDGIKFERVELKGRDSQLSDAVYTLRAEDSGDLWIGYAYGGASRLSQEHFQHFDQRQGMPRASVLAFARDFNGTLWAATANGLVRFDGAAWRKVEIGVTTDAQLITLRVDEQGTLWIATNLGMCQLTRGSSQIRCGDIPTQGRSGLLQAPDGRNWYLDEAGAHLLPAQRRTPRSWRSNAREPMDALFDQEGYLWTIREGGKLLRVRVPTDSDNVTLDQRSPTEHFTSKDTLSGAPHAMIEDREGNIWTATAGGVDRFRRTILHRIQTQDDSALRTTLAPAANGAIWIGARYADIASHPDEGLWKYDGALKRIAANQIAKVDALETDTRGSLWIGADGSVWKHDSEGRPYMLPALRQPSLVQTINILHRDSNGALWAVVSGVANGTYKYAGSWEPVRDFGGLSQRKPRAMANDPQGRLWLGFPDGSLAFLHGGEVRTYPPASGHSFGGVEALSAGRRIVAAGYKSLNVLNGEHLQALTALGNPEALAGVSSIVETANGDLWLNSFAGAVHITNNHLEAALRTRAHIVPVEIFDTRDGFPGTALAKGRGTLVQATDGRLWFAGTNGVAGLDPQNIRRNSMPPPVVIKSIVAGEQTYDQPRTIDLPQASRDLQVNFSALSFSRPERVVARYRLEGYDAGWIDAGQRRQAFYTNLKPGKYRFSVIAANEHGVWNDVGASVNISIPPRFTETWTFLLLCALGALTLLWTAVTLWIKQLTRRQRSRLEERLSERERIARELHDTLLQGVQGLILHFQTVADRIDDRGETRAAMEDALERADALLIEGRDRVKDLRSSPDDPMTLQQALSNAANQRSEGESPRILVVETGAARPLHPIVQEETARIATEALTNALRHAHATIIEVEIAFDKQQLRVGVKDDGIGMDENILRNGREGHFGLLGMRERATRIRGRLTVWSRPSAGTEVRLVVPAAMAYRRGPG